MQIIIDFDPVTGGAKLNPVAGVHPLEVSRILINIGANVFNSVQINVEKTPDGQDGEKKIIEMPKKIAEPSKKIVQP